MTPHARAFALRAAGKVALAGAAAGCEPRPAESVHVETLAPDAAGVQPTATDLAPPVDAAASPPTSGACDVENVSKPSDAELACCVALVPTDGDSSTSYMKYAAVLMHAADAGTPATQETRVCCEALEYGADGLAKDDPKSPRIAESEARRWTCCAALVSDGRAPPAQMARCTPWGPPVPPAMDWA